MTISEINTTLKDLKRTKEILHWKNKIVDMKVIQDLKKMNDPVENNFFVDIITLFLSEIPGLMKDILDSYNQSDFVKMSGVAHSLKGASLNLGAVCLADLCASIETSAKENNISKIREAMMHLVQVCKLTSYEFKKIITT